MFFKKEKETKEKLLLNRLRNIEKKIQRYDLRIKRLKKTGQGYALTILFLQHAKQRAKNWELDPSQRPCKIIKLNQ